MLHTHIFPNLKEQGYTLLYDYIQYFTSNIYAR